MGTIQADFAGNYRRVQHDDADAEIERRFGFPASLIRSAATLALREASGIDDLHAQQSAKGAMFYHHFVIALRDSLDILPEWDAQLLTDINASPRAYHSRLGIGFAVVHNLSRAKDSSAHPRVSLCNTTATEVAEGNSAEDDIFSSFFIRREIAQHGTLWLIVYHKNPDDTAHIEVSLPSSVSTNNIVQGWSERIILDPVGLNTSYPEQLMEEHHDDGNGEENIVVSISER